MFNSIFGIWNVKWMYICVFRRKLIKKNSYVILFYFYIRKIIWYLGKGNVYVEGRRFIVKCILIWEGGWIIFEIFMYKNRIVINFFEYNNNIFFNIFLKRYFFSKKIYFGKWKYVFNLLVIVLRFLSLKY